MKPGFHRPASAVTGNAWASTRPVSKTANAAPVADPALNYKACGPCSQCCITEAVADFEKPAHQACHHERPGRGCSIWGLHPTSCQSFRCVWIKHPRLDDRWRPDVAGFVLRDDADGISLHVDVAPHRSGAWLAEPYQTQLRMWSEGILSGEGRVLIHDGPWHILMTPDEDLPIRAVKRGEWLESGIEMSLFGPRVFVRICSGRQTSPARQRLSA